MFKRSRDVPEQVSAAGLAKWYSSIDEQSKVRMGRYLNGMDADAPVKFFISVMDRALDDENPHFAAFMGESALKGRMSDVQMFMLTERLIEAYVGSGRYVEAKKASYDNLDLYPNIRDELFADGKIPDDVSCRNRLIDILVGIESDYDAADGLLDRFHDMGLISKEDLDFRRRSLKVHRLQRTFDGVYTYRPKCGRE